MTVKEAIDFVDKEYEHDSIILELYEYVKDLLLAIETDENNTIKKLQEENERLKNKLYYDKRNVFAELNDDTAHSNEMLLLELADAKEIIEGYLKITKSWNYDFKDILDWNKKARAFLEE